MTNHEKSADPISQDHQDQAALAHSIIEALLNHTRVVSDLIALMAQALDQDTTKALTLTPAWQAYLESRRRMEQTREDLEKFVEMINEPGERTEQDSQPSIQRD